MANLAYLSTVLIFAYCFIPITLCEELDCREIKEELDSNGGDNLDCTSDGNRKKSIIVLIYFGTYYSGDHMQFINFYYLEEPICVNIKLTDIEDESDDRKVKKIPGSYQYIGRWQGTNGPVYRREIDDEKETEGPFYLYHSKNKQWFISDVSQSNNFSFVY